MFNFNRILNRIADPNKAIQNPARPPSDGNSSEAAEGFLCPTCLQAFPSPESLQNHYETSHVDAVLGAASDSKKTRGTYLCPACKMRLGSERELQSHYSRHHSTKTEEVFKNGDLVTLKQELSELQTSLKEEKWYSEELKKEVERLQSTIAGKTDREADEVELGLLRSQVRALEEGKALISSEVVLLRQQLAESIATVNTLKQDKEKLELKAGKLAGDLALLQAQHDELQGDKSVLEKQLRDAEDNLASLKVEARQRPAGDDVAVLQQELVSVQRMMDQLTLEKEEEKKSLEEKYSQLLESYNSSAEDLGKYTAQISELESSLEKKTSENESLLFEIRKIREELESLQTNKEEAESALKEVQEELEGRTIEVQKTVLGLAAESRKIQELNICLAEAQSALQEANNEKEKLKEMVSAKEKAFIDEIGGKDQVVGQMKMDLEKVSRKLAKRESQVRDLERQLAVLQEHYQQQCVISDDFKAQLWEKNSQLDETQRISEGRENRLNELETEVSRLKEEISRFETERAELYAKIEVGEGANTAIQQLKSENEALQQRIETQTQLMEQTVQEYTSKIESLHKQLAEAKIQVKALEDQRIGVERTLADVNKKLESVQNSTTQLQDQLTDKANTITMLEGEKAKMASDLQRQLKSALADADDKAKQLAAFKEKSKSLEDAIKSGKDESAHLQTELNGLQEKLTELKQQCSTLEDANKTKADKISLLTTENKELNKTLDNKSQQITSLENSIKLKEETFNKQIEEAEKEKQKMKSQVSSIEKARADLEKQIAQLTSSLDKECAEKLNLTKKLKSEEERSKALEGSLRDKQNEVVSLNSEIAKLKANVGKAEAYIAKLKEENAELHIIKSDHAALQAQLQNLDKRLSESAERERELNAAVENMNEAKSQLSQKVLRLDEEVHQLKDAKNVLQAQKESLEMECSNKTKQLEDLEMKFSSVKKQLTSLTQTYNEEKESMAKEIRDLQDTKQLLIQQKLTLQNQIEDLQNQIAQKAKLQEEMDKKLAKEVETLEEHKKNLEAKLESESQSRKKLQQERHQEKTELNTQITVLTENVSTLKEDLANEQSKREVLEKKVDELAGDKLDLQAKFENAQDERRALLERCVNSESEYEKLRVTTADLRRKLDDSIAALQELGRENQTLQIENTKHSTRRWADDSEVTNCTACKRLFTVTIRKHHCRHCGNIFCHECSSKSATVAASKKPVRVCDSCYIDVTK